MCPKECIQPPDLCETKEAIYCKYDNAVVGVSSQFIFMSGAAQVNSLTDVVAQPNPAGIRADLFLKGNGFFINKHYIATTADLVLAPPAVSAVARRFPFGSDPLPNGNVIDTMIPASRIVVTVNQVNNKKRDSYPYEAKIHLVFGMANIAILKIIDRRCSDYNTACQPTISKDHPMFRLRKTDDYFARCVSVCKKSNQSEDSILEKPPTCGGSPKGELKPLAPGETAYILGDVFSSVYDEVPLGSQSSGLTQISQGVVAAPSQMEIKGDMLSQMLVISGVTAHHARGSPVVDCTGEVIGMMVNTETGIVGNVSAVPSSLIRAVFNRASKDIKRLEDGCSNGPCSVECVEYGNTSFYRYVCGYLGLAHKAFTPELYDLTVDYTSGSPVAGMPRSRISAAGELPQSFPSNRQAVGVLVMGLAGLNPDDVAAIPNGHYYVPGGVGATPPLAGLQLPNSPLLNKLAPGDMIYEADGCEVGAYPGQRTLSNVLWGSCPRRKISLCVRKGGNALNAAAADTAFVADYENKQVVEVCLEAAPKLMDYPYYNVDKFPSIIAPVAPGTYPAVFVNPNIVSAVMVPQRSAPDAGVFRPAI